MLLSPSHIPPEKSAPCPKESRERCSRCGRLRPKKKNKKSGEKKRAADEEVASTRYVHEILAAEHASTGTGSKLQGLITLQTSVKTYRSDGSTKESSRKTGKKKSNRSKSKKSKSKRSKSKRAESKRSKSKMSKSQKSTANNCSERERSGEATVSKYMKKHGYRKYTMYRDKRGRFVRVPRRN
ncbi:hypothetical protein RB195_000762 [Necator americanus]|uniref:Uncharacterized protein n=2 Tax=Necator americanus TaxID=51031 RepID=A0ABR1DB92_NECAM